jgi:hypothetical protein
MNDNEGEGPENLTEEDINLMIGVASDMAARIERRYAITWLNKNAADLLFATGIDPKLQDFGTSLLEMIADALENKEHWQYANITKETVQ